MRTFRSRHALTSTLFSLLLLVLVGCSGDDGKDGAPGRAGEPGADAGGNQFSVRVDGVGPSDPAESIYVRKVGHGERVIVLIPGNNTSGASFEPLLQVFRAVERLNRDYTVYAFDYRGSGRSSYNTRIRGLGDFAGDFEQVLRQLERRHGFPGSDVTLVGYSMGFAVALEMAIRNPARYGRLVGLAPVGTRGVRVSFNAAQAGTDALNNSYAAGDWVPVADDEAGIAATELQQRSWQGENRTWANVQSVWDMVVFNDVLGYDLASFSATDEAFRADPAYAATFADVLQVEYMPESLYYAHKFNVSDATVTAPAPNASGETVSIVGDGRLNAAGLAGRQALLVKAATDLAAWRGDLVIYDNYVQTSKFDLKEAGVSTTAVLIRPDQDYDHGFPITHPLAVARLLDTFIQGELSAASVAAALGGVELDYYPPEETEFETDTFTGL